MYMTLENALDLLNEISNIQRAVRTIFKQEMLFKKENLGFYKEKFSPVSLEPSQQLEDLKKNFEEIIRSAINKQKISKLSDLLDLSQSTDSLKKDVSDLFEDLCKEIEDKYSIKNNNNNTSNQTPFDIEKTKKSILALGQLYKNLMELIITEHDFAQSCQSISKRRDEIIDLFKKTLQVEEITEDKMKKIGRTYKSICDLSKVKNLLEFTVEQKIKFSTNICYFLQSIYKTLKSKDFKNFFNETLIPSVISYQNDILPIITEINRFKESKNSGFSSDNRKTIDEFSSGLAKPFQRMCRYSLLISDISKKIDACQKLGTLESEKKFLITGSNKPSSIEETIKNLLEYINEITKECEQKMGEITEKNKNEMPSFINCTKYKPDQNKKLMEAVLSQDVELVSSLLEQGAKSPLDKELEDPTANSALITAAKIGCYDGVAEMIASLPDLTSKHKERAMIIAASFGYARIVLCIISDLQNRENDYKQKNNDAFQQVIRKAAEFDHSNVLELMLINLGFKDDGHYALYSSAKYKNCRVKSCKFLLQHTVDVLVEEISDNKTNNDISLDKLEKHHTSFFDFIIRALTDRIEQKNLPEEKMNHIEKWLLDEKSLINQLLKTIINKEKDSTNLFFKPENKNDPAEKIKSLIQKIQEKKTFQKNPNFH